MSESDNEKERCQLPVRSTSDAAGIFLFVRTFFAMMTARTAAASAFILASCACVTAVAAAEPPANGLHDLLATGSANVYSKVLPDYADYGDETNGGGGIIGGSDYFYSDPYSVSRRSDMVASYTGGNNEIAQAPSGNLNHRMQEIPLSFDPQTLQDLKESRVDQIGHRVVGGDHDLDYHVGHLHDDPHGSFAWPSSEPMTFTHWTKHLMQEHSAFKFAVYFTVTFFFAAFVLISATKFVYGDAASVDLTRILPTGYGEESSTVEEAASGAERVFKMIENFTENFIGAAATTEVGDSDSSGEAAIKSVGAENTTERDGATEVTPSFSPLIGTTSPPQDESTKKSASLRSNDDAEDDYDENSINSMLQGLVHNQEQLSKMTMEEKMRLMEILEEQKMRLMGYTTEKETTTTAKPTTNRNLNQGWSLIANDGSNLSRGPSIRFG